MNTYGKGAYKKKRDRKGKEGRNGAKERGVRRTKRTDGPRNKKKKNKAYLKKKGKTYLEGFDNHGEGILSKEGGVKERRHSLKTVK